MRFSSILKSISLVRFRNKVSHKVWNLTLAYDRKKQESKIWTEMCFVWNRCHDITRRYDSLSEKHLSLFDIRHIKNFTTSLANNQCCFMDLLDSERWPSHIVEKNYTRLSHFTNCIDDCSFVFLLTTNMLHPPMFPHSILLDNNY